MPRRRVAGAVLLVITVCATGWAARGVDAARRDMPDLELLYLPNGKYLRLMSVGHASLMADAVYLWAIQYYSDYTRRDRYRYVQHVFGDVITELDPHYIDPYWLGALILIIEAGDFEGGLELLDKGARLNPDSWILPWVAAWECYRLKRYDQAASYFEQASRVPGAPTRVRRMRAGMLSRMGQIREAIALWREVREDPRSDAVSVAIAGRQLRELEVQHDLERLRQALATFRKDNGRWPGSLAELAAGSYIAEVPLDPEGRGYTYDPIAGEVGSAAARVLGES